MRTAGIALIAGSIVIEFLYLLFIIGIAQTKWAANDWRVVVAVLVPISVMCVGLYLIRSARVNRGSRESSQRINDQ